MDIQDLLRKLTTSTTSPSRLSPEELDNALRDRANWEDLRRSGGWKILTQALVSEANEAVQKMTKQVSERDRDYLASRIQVIGWVLDLPESKVKEYNDLLNETPDDPADPSDDGQCPIPEDD